MPGGTYTTIDNPPAVTTTAASVINNTVQIVGQYRDASDRRHGYLLSGGTFFTTDDPLATGDSITNGINDMGQIVGQFTDAAGKHGFLVVPQPNPPPPAGTTADMILRHDADGLYEIY